MTPRPRFKRPEDVTIPSIDFIKGYHLTFEVPDFDMVDENWVVDTYTGKVIDFTDRDIIFESEDGEQFHFDKYSVADGLILQETDFLASHIRRNYYAIEEHDKLTRRATPGGYYCIYGLADPRDQRGIPFYVGMSGEVERRYTQHITSHHGNILKIRRIQAIQRLGLQPILLIFERDLGKLDALEREQDVIQFYREQGVDLVNDTLNDVEVGA